MFRLRGRTSSGPAVSADTVPAPPTPLTRYTDQEPVVLDSAAARHTYSVYAPLTGVGRGGAAAMAAKRTSRSTPATPIHAHPHPASPPAPPPPLGARDGSTSARLLRPGTVIRDSARHGCSLVHAPSASSAKHRADLSVSTVNTDISSASPEPQLSPTSQVLSAEAQPTSPQSSSSDRNYMPSLANICSAHLHNTTGAIPPPLVGASVTLVESGPGTTDRGEACLYVFGGRLADRRVTSSLYVLNLVSLVWSFLGPGTNAPMQASTPSGDRHGLDNFETCSSAWPEPRYFHGANVWKGRLVISAGMALAHGLEGNRDSSETVTMRSRQPSQTVESDSTPRTPMGRSGSVSDEPVVLMGIVAYDLANQTWDLAFDRSDDAAPSSMPTGVPEARYAHLSAITGDYLVCIGGQNARNEYIHNMHVFSLRDRFWIRQDSISSKIGAYRSFTATPKWSVMNEKGTVVEAASAMTANDVSAQNRFTKLRTPLELPCWLSGNQQFCVPRVGISDSTGHPVASTPSPLTQGSFGSDFASTGTKSINASLDLLEKLGHVSKEAISEKRIDERIHPLPTSVPYPSKPKRLPPIYVYSNSRFTDVQRELRVFHYEQDSNGNIHDLHVDDISPRMAQGREAIKSYANRNRQSLPPGLRFPTGYVVGEHMVISGTHLGVATQAHSVWTLHLPSLVWTHLDSEVLLQGGSWNRAVFHPDSNKLLIFGARRRSLGDDYQARQANSEQLAALSLDAWGIYQPPLFQTCLSGVALGIDMLSSSQHDSLQMDRLRQQGIWNARTHPAALGGQGDFEILCLGGERLGASRALLERRWTWFRDAMRLYRGRALHIARISAVGEDDMMVLRLGKSDVRVTPRWLQLYQPPEVVSAFLLYLYTGTLATAPQRHPRVVLGLLSMANLYSMSKLREWCAHALHFALASELAPLPSSEQMNPDDRLQLQTLQSQLPNRLRLLFAQGIYEAAALAESLPLQVRALRSVIDLKEAVAGSHGSRASSGSDEVKSSYAHRSSLSRALPPSPIFPAPNTARDSGEAARVAVATFSSDDADKPTGLESALSAAPTASREHHGHSVLAAISSPSTLTATNSPVRDRQPACRSSVSNISSEPYCVVAHRLDALSHSAPHSPTRPRGGKKVNQTHQPNHVGPFARSGSSHSQLSPLDSVNHLLGWSYTPSSASSFNGERDMGLKLKRIGRHDRLRAVAEADALSNPSSQVTYLPPVAGGDAGRDGLSDPTCPHDVSSAIVGGSTSSGSLASSVSGSFNSQRGPLITNRTASAV